MSFAEELKKQEASNRQFQQKSSSWFKFKEGSNKIRILTRPELFYEDFSFGICYHDCGYTGSPKFLVRVLDREDGKVKMMRLPYRIGKQVADLENDEDYGFTGFPMPYDLKIIAKNAGDKSVEYSVLPTNKSELGEIEEFLDDVSEVLEKMKEKQVEKHEKDGTRAKLLATREQIKKNLESNDETGEKTIEYPEDEINPTEIPF